MTNTHLTDLFSVGASEKREKAKKSRKWRINVLRPNAFMLRLHPGRMLLILYINYPNAKLTRSFFDFVEVCINLSTPDVS